MKKLLIVDDEEINRLTLESGLCDLYEIIQAENGKKALEILYFDELIDAVLLDINMPEMDGFGVLKELSETGLIKKIPVFIITSETNDEELLRAYSLGAVDVINKPYNIQFLRRRVGNTIELYSQRNGLSRLVEEKTQELIRQSNRLVEAMADIVEFRSNESGSHVKRVSGYTRILMEGLINSYPEYEYLYDDVDAISFAACLHDIGKISVPDNILNKPEKLSGEEFDIMKSHTAHGYEQIRSLKDIMEPKLYEYSLDIARHHHERYDGRGYPDHLKGDENTIWAQATGLADVYDALTTERCYKNAYDHDSAVKLIMQGDCGVFHPQVMEVFQRLNKRMDEFRQEIKRKKILIVDDSDIDRSSLRTMLSDYDITEVEAGFDALFLLRKKFNDFDVVILDVILPNIDGFSLLKKLGPEFVQTTPVIMCSGEVNKQVITAAADIGVRAFLRKPFNYDSVVKKVKDVIDFKKGEGASL